MVKYVLLISSSSNFKNVFLQIISQSYGFSLGVLGIEFGVE